MAKQKLEFDMTANNKDLKKKTKESKSLLKGVGAGFATLGVGLGVSSIISGLKEVINELDEIGKISSNLGISTDATQALQLSAEKAGVSEGQIERVLGNIATKVDNATVMGDKRAQMSFKRLGLTTSDLKAMGLEEVFVAISKSIDKMEGKQRLALAREFFGGRGTRMITAGKSFNDELYAMRESKMLVDEQAIKNAEELNDRMAELWKATKVTWTEFAGGVYSGAKILKNDPSQAGNNIIENMKDLIGVATEIKDKMDDNTGGI